MTTRPTADEIPALLEPIARDRIPGADGARIVDWRGTDRGFSTETFLFELEIDGTPPTTLKRLVFRRPPQVSLFPDYDLLRQVLVMNRLHATPISVPTVCWLDRDDDTLGTPYYVMEQVATVGTPVALACPVSRLETRFREDGLLTDDVDLVGSASNGSISCWTSGSP